MFNLKKVDWKLVLGILNGIFLLYLVLADDKERRHFEELALGTENTAPPGLVEGLAVHCHDLVDADECLTNYERTGRPRPVLLWLGNSQLHAINQFKPGEETAAPELHRRFQRHGDYFLTFSQPNASLQEHYLLLAYLLSRLPIETLVLPVVFDDMREDGIRDSLIGAFRDQTTIVFLNNSTIGQIMIANHDGQIDFSNDMAALEDTVQERSEKVLNSILEEVWSIWAKRPTLRGETFNWMYQFRNWVLGINPSSTRKMIPGRYAKNRDAFVAILDLAAVKKVKVLVYIVPLRNDVKVPYDTQEYSIFKSEIEQLSKNSSAHFVDFESLVPGQLWGSKSATTLGGEQELDFMHFQAGGHHLLAEALYQELSMLRSSP